MAEIFTNGCNIPKRVRFYLTLPLFDTVFEIISENAAEVTKQLSLRAKQVTHSYWRVVVNQLIS